MEDELGKALKFAALGGGADKPPPKKPGAGKSGAKPAPQKPTASQPAGFHLTHHWTKDLPLVVRAMVQAGDTLFIAGPPDVVDEEAAAQKLGTPEIQAQLAELRLKTPPAWDGMAAAGGCLYLSTTDGKIVCLAGR